MCPDVQRPKPLPHRGLRKTPAERMGHNGSILLQGRDETVYYLKCRPREPQRINARRTAL